METLIKKKDAMKMIKRLDKKREKLIACGK